MLRQDPWPYGKYAQRAFPCLDPFLLRQNCRAPASDAFSSDFCSLKRRRADARQAEKGQKAPGRHTVRRVCPCPSMLSFLYSKNHATIAWFLLCKHKARRLKLGGALSLYMHGSDHAFFYFSVVSTVTVSSPSATPTSSREPGSRSSPMIFRAMRVSTPCWIYRRRGRAP